MLLRRLVTPHHADWLCVARERRVLCTLLAAGTIIGCAASSDLGGDGLVRAFIQQRFTVGRLAHQRELSEDSKPFTSTASIPDFSVFAPELTLRPGLFTRNVPKLTLGGSGHAILFRTMLQGGELANERNVDGIWSLDHLRRDLDNPASMVFPMCGEALWTRQVTDRDDMVVTITDFAGRPEVELTLEPGDDGVISLRVANLCTENPLGWKELPDRETILEDSDFKWLYTLFEPPPTQGTRDEQREWDDYLMDLVLPAPKLLSQINDSLSHLQARKMACPNPPGGCAAATKSEKAGFPLLQEWTR